MATRCEPDRDLEAWRVAHEVRIDLNSALLRLHLFERAYLSEAADQTATLILAAPKIGPHADQIRTRVAELLHIPTDCIGIKAKTPEGMGTENAAIAHAVVLLERAPRNVRRKSQKKLPR